MSDTYRLVAAELEFEVQFTTKEFQSSSFYDTITKPVLRFYNKKYNIVVDHVINRNLAMPKDFKLIDNLKYALENGYTTLHINGTYSKMLFEATFGTIREESKIYTTVIEVGELKEAMLQKKYDDLLKKYNALEKTHNELLEKSHTCTGCQKPS